MYTIKVKYQTGDSFHTEETDDLLGCCWDDIELARKGLQAIKEHHEIYQYKDIDSNKKARKYKWYNKEYPEYGLLLKVDNGSKQKISTFWIGYFETLRSVEIVSNDKKDKYIVGD